jgi:trimethylamine:corrinoid methyltransferase-like protein
MSDELKPLEPIKTPYRLRYLSDEQLNRLQEATLSILERTGVKFPSEKALKVLAEHGVKVDFEKQVACFPRAVVKSYLAKIPRYFNIGARASYYDFHLADGCTYFTTDGCGVETIDLDTRQRRASCKEDVGMMARGRWSARRNTVKPLPCTTWTPVFATPLSTSRVRPLWVKRMPVTRWKCPR